MRKDSWKFFLMTTLLAANVRAQVMVDPGNFTRPWLRGQFEIAENNKTVARELVRTIEQDGILKDQSCPPIVSAYYGAAKTLEAKFNPNPVIKVEAYYAGMKWLDQAVAAAPQDLEVRFLRFATLHHVPSILGDRNKRKEDLQKVQELLFAKEYSLVDQQTQSRMIDLLLESDRLSAMAMRQLKNLRSELRP